MYLNKVEIFEYLLILKEKQEKKASTIAKIILVVIKVRKIELRKLLQSTWHRCLYYLCGISIRVKE